MIEVTAFRQIKTEIEIQVGSPQSQFSSAKYLPAVPESIQLNELDVYQDLEISKSADSLAVSVRFPESEPDSHEYSIVLIDLVSESYLEIVRQSEAFLVNRFGFNRAAGYCIAGRRNVLLGQGEKVLEQPLQVFYGKADVPRAQGASEKCDAGEEIQVAKEILEWMFTKNLNTGPIGKNHKRYELAKFEKKIAMLEQAKYAVQCATFRDLFVHAAVVRGLDVRSVGGLNYSPQYPDLLTYSHSLCEIWVSALQKYIIFDPWFGGLMVIEGGSPIGAVRLQSLKRREGLRLVAVLPKIERLIIDGAGNPARYTFRNADVSLHSYLFIKEIGCCMPGYSEYFHHVITRRVVVRSRLLIYIAMGYRLAASVGRKIAKMAQHKMGKK